MNLKKKIKKMRNKLGDEDWISPKTKIRESKIGGKGLFAIEPISKGELVIVWGGEYVDSEQAEKARKNGKLVMQWDEDLYSVETPGEGVGYFINHSCEPNTWMEGAYALTAMRDIEQGEEVTIDYAVWEADEDYISEWDCNCGSENCRGKITGKDWQLPELQKKYKGHFSPLINKMVESKKELLERIENIHLDCHKLIRDDFGEYYPVSGNMGVFCQSDEKYKQFTEVREKLTEVSDNPDQKYFKLDEAIVIPEQNDIPEAVYTHLYIRKFDPSPYGKHSGDVDFILTTEEYQKLKKKVLVGEFGKNVKMYDRTGWDTIQITDPEVDAVAYISTQQMAEKARVKF